MIVTSLNSERRYAPFPHGVTGYRASRIEIDAHDIIAMRELAERDPPRFHAAMSQLAARFPFNENWARMKLKPPREMLADDIGVGHRPPGVSAGGWPAGDDYGL